MTWRGAGFAVLSRFMSCFVMAWHESTYKVSLVLLNWPLAVEKSFWHFITKFFHCIVHLRYCMCHKIRTLRAVHQELQFSVSAERFWGNTLFEGAFITLTCHKYDITPVINTNKSFWMFMTVVIKCHLVNYDTFNANIHVTWFKMTTWH